jgi:hypothetical protein
MGGELLTLQQVGEYLAYKPKRARESARKFVERHGLRRLWRGKAWLVKREDVDAVLEGRKPTGRVAA